MPRMQGNKSIRKTKKRLDRGKKLGTMEQKMLSIYSEGRNQQVLIQLIRYVRFSCYPSFRSLKNCSLRNRNLKTSKALLKSQAYQGTSLVRSAAANQRGVKSSSGPISRIPGRDRVAVKVGVVQVEKVNNQMGQGRSV